MRFKVLILFVCILMVGIAISNDGEVTAQLKVKKVFPSDQIASDQSARRVNLVSTLGAYAVLFNTVDFSVTRSDSYYLDHTLEYYADASKEVKFILIITGPENATYTSDWYHVNANTVYTFSVNWQDTWQPGFYYVNWTIWVRSGKAGGTLGESNSFIVY